jgi:beta-lactamase regulating signal transducer with metallopeptidase domain
MSALFDNATVWMGLQIFVKSSLLVGAGALLQWSIGRRSSAASRHLIWSVVIVGMLGLPVLAAVLPGWDIAVPVARGPAIAVMEAGGGPTVAPAAVVAAASANNPADASGGETVRGVGESQPISWTTAGFVLYVSGVLVLLAYLASEQLSIRRLALHASAIDDADWTLLLGECCRSLGIERPVRLLRSRHHTMPMAFGTRSPVILLPAVADLWTDDRRRAVVLHELAHVSRRDCLTQTLAAVACAVYWIHPGAWWVARRLRVERELACDDLVLTSGTSAREYAGHLLELAHTLGGGRAPALVVTMARPKQLEGRMLAVMDAARSRRVPGRGSRLAGLAVAVALVMPLASANATVVEPGALPAPAVDAAAAEPPVVSGAPTAARSAVTAARKTGKSSKVQAAVDQPNMGGTWEIRQSPIKEMIYLRLTEGRWDSSFSIPLDRLEGLSLSQLSGASGPVRFSIRRDAGTFSFEGTARNGVAGGTYTFTPSPTYGAELAKRGFERPTDAEQYSLARGDISFAFLDELTKQSYPRPTTPQLVRAGEHGVHLDYLRGMGTAGYRLDSLERLITLRDHGVGPEFIRELAEQNVKGLTADELQRIRDHGVNGKFVREFRDLGYPSATIADLVKAKDHGVNPQFVKDLAAMGHSKLALDEVIRLRDHGVSSEFAKDLRNLGHDLTIEQLVKARDHGVSVEFASEIASLGYRNQPIDTLIKLRDHGVSARYIRELKELGYDRLDLDELISLRDHGVTTDKIRRANERAKTRLPLDLIRSLADGGMK